MGKRERVKTKRRWVGAPPAPPPGPVSGLIKRLRGSGRGGAELGGGAGQDEGQNPAPPGDFRRVWWLPWHVGELRCAWGGRWYVFWSLLVCWSARPAILPRTAQRQQSKSRQRFESADWHPHFASVWGVAWKRTKKSPRAPKHHAGDTILVNDTTFFSKS